MSRLAPDEMALLFPILFKVPLGLLQPLTEVGIVGVRPPHYPESSHHGTSVSPPPPSPLPWAIFSHI